MDHILDQAESNEPEQRTENDFRPGRWIAHSKISKDAWAAEIGGISCPVIDAALADGFDRRARRHHLLQVESGEFRAVDESDAPSNSPNCAALLSSATARATTSLTVPVAVAICVRRRKGKYVGSTIASPLSIGAYGRSAAATRAMIFFDTCACTNSAMARTCCVAAAAKASANRESDSAACSTSARGKSNRSAESASVAKRAIVAPPSNSTMFPNTSVSSASKRI